ncbi:MAG: hypothetical protein VB080_03310 [Propionicimonas sp.]|uniref:COX15/CtaA family protein n=1 Tax=Propionicimonas sp. TaxID=1955623 RepID=UPI002B1F478D|nr:COX15/CtaA family protein [Propionicimonas sp.]MEA4943446.1 hypothetical protein [Propionicimonas sp.]
MTQSVPSSTVRRAYWVAAILTGVVVLMGSAVCATESGLACPTWPGCFHDQLTPTGTNSAIEFSHRVVAFLDLVSLAVASWLGRGLPDRRLRLFPVGALVAAIASGVFGMTIVLFGLPMVLGMVDVAAALVALCLITAAAVWLSRPAVAGGTPLGRLGWTTVGAVIVMHLLGIVVAGEGSFVRCLGWPVWRVVDSDSFPGLQAVRLVLGVVAGALLVWLIVRTLPRPALRPWAVTLGLLWLAELVMGQVIVGQFTGGEPRHLALAAGYSMLAGAMLWVLILLTARASGEDGVTAPLSPDREVSAAGAADC